MNVFDTITEFEQEKLNTLKSLIENSSFFQKYSSDSVRRIEEDRLAGTVRVWLNRDAYYKGRAYHDLKNTTYKQTNALCEQFNKILEPLDTKVTFRFETQKVYFRLTNYHEAKQVNVDDVQVNPSLNDINAKVLKIASIIMQTSAMAKECTDYDFVFVKHDEKGKVVCKSAERFVPYVNSSLANYLPRVIYHAADMLLENMDIIGEYKHFDPDTMIITAVENGDTFTFDL